MTTTLLRFLACLVALAPVAARAQDDAAAITKLATDFAQVIERGDLDRLAAFYSPAAVYLVEGEPPVDHEVGKAVVKHWRRMIGSNRATDCGHRPRPARSRWRRSRRHAIGQRANAAVHISVFASISHGPSRCRDHGHLAEMRHNAQFSGWGEASAAHGMVTLVAEDIDSALLVAAPSPGLLSLLY